MENERFLKLLLKDKFLFYLCLDYLNNKELVVLIQCAKRFKFLLLENKSSSVLWKKRTIPLKIDEKKTVNTVSFFPKNELIYSLDITKCSISEEEKNPFSPSLFDLSYYPNLTSLNYVEKMSCSFLTTFKLFETKNNTTPTKLKHLHLEYDCPFSQRKGDTFYTLPNLSLNEFTKGSYPHLQSLYLCNLHIDSLEPLEYLASTLLKLTLYQIVSTGKNYFHPITKLTKLEELTMDIEQNLQSSFTTSSTFTNFLPPSKHYSKEGFIRKWNTFKYPVELFPAYKLASLTKLKLKGVALLLLKCFYASSTTIKELILQGETEEYGLDQLFLECFSKETFTSSLSSLHIYLEDTEDRTLIYPFFSSSPSLKCPLLRTFKLRIDSIDPFEFLDLNSIFKANKYSLMELDLSHFKGCLDLDSLLLFKQLKILSLSTGFITGVDDLKIIAQLFSLKELMFQGQHSSTFFKCRQLVGKIKYLLPLCPYLNNLRFEEIELFQEDCENLKQFKNCSLFFLKNIKVVTK